MSKCRIFVAIESVLSYISRTTMMNFIPICVFISTGKYFEGKTESKVVDLRCEHLTAPLGVDTKTPD